MRWDNAARRLSPFGRKAGLIGDARWGELERHWMAEDRERERLEGTRLVPSEQMEALCRKMGAEVLSEPVTAAGFLRHRGVSYALIAALTPPEHPLELEEASHVETELRYAGYLEKEARVAARMANLDGALIPEGFDYASVSGLSAEGRQKLAHFRPRSLGQALRISGVTPTDVQLLSVGIRHAG